MSGSIASGFLSPNELLAPREYWRRQQETDQQGLATERAVDAYDRGQIANTAGYLLTLPEDKRAEAYALARSTMPDHMRARAPEGYLGHDWLQSVYHSAIPAEKQWETDRTGKAIDALLPPVGGGTAPRAGGGGGGTGAPLSPYIATNLPAGITPEEDQYVRTVYGEARGEPVAGQQAVAYTIRNRSKSGGESSQDVIFRPNAYEPWNNPTTRAQLEALDPNSADYQKILTGVVRPVMSGQAQDPTGGATHFYSPKAQAALGRETPSWATGNQTTIGGHTFFYPGYSAASGAPARGVAARTGGTDTAGPGAGPSPAPPAPPVPGAPPSPLAGAGSPPNKLTRTDLPAPPSTEQIARQMGLDADGLTQQDYAELRALRGAPGVTAATVAQQKEARATRNQAQVDRIYTQQRQAQQDVLAQKKSQDEARTRGLPPGYQWSADGTSMEPIPGQDKGAISGAGDNGQLNALVSLASKMRAGTDTADDRAAYALLHARLSSPHTADAQDPNDPTRTIKVNYPGMTLDPEHFPPPKRASGAAGAAPGAVPVPGTGQQSASTAEKIRMAGVETGKITGAIDTFLGELEQQGGASWRAWANDPTSPEAQRLNAKFDVMKTMLRSEAFANTGVLQPHEAKMLEDMLLSPSTLRGLFASPEAVKARLGVIKDALLRYQKLQSGEPPSGAPSSGTSPAGGPVTVKTAAEAQALPPGTRYTTPDGRVFKR
jgi:hypothetical protein